MSTKTQFRELCRIAIHYEIVYCYLCGELIKPGQKWNLDHMQPKSKGGKNNYQNLKPVHFDCNSEKDNMTVEQWQKYKSKTR